MADQDRFSQYRYNEGRTGIGQLVKFTQPLDVDDEEIADFLRKNIRTIDIPTTGRVNVGHGGYGQYTRYNITQHKYAGGGHTAAGGYIEVLEIKNPPDDRWGIVINEWGSSAGGTFTEWETLEHAKAAFKKLWSSPSFIEKEFPELPGFKRRVVCGAIIPWFYAIGDEQLVGDYAFPEGLQEDATYRFGRQFVVFDRNNIPSVKTCMGTRVVNRKKDYYPHEEQTYRLVYWEDGSVWNEVGIDHSRPPRPLEDGEVWITEAIQEFKKLLAGNSVGFTIKFTDGNKFVGKMMSANPKARCAEGDYLLVVRLKGKEEPLEGWVNDFKPTEETPDIVQHVIKRYADRGHEVEHVRVKDSKIKKGGKKWRGAFFYPPNDR